MSKINILDEHLTNMIAAGEVVERPMGVIKELVENSIDAHATKICIKIQNGGLDSIQVIDDGCGMDSKDSTMAFSRHATSKIINTNDLWKIGTMGFRGEALPSIASVSKVTLLTNDGNDSTEVKVEYGKITSAKPMAFSQGTSILVEGLFYKTPARLKHLKSSSIEANMIFDLVQKIALAHPEIAFELYSDDKIRIQTNGSGDLQETIMTLYGLDVAKKCIEINTHDYDFEIKGYIVSPAITRSTRQYLNCSMNGRIIRSLSLQKAIIDGYHTFMMPDRFPIVVLNIKADFQLVDVNVHPSKWEIRISKEKQLYSLISNSIQETLKSYNRPSDLIVEHIQENNEISSLQDSGTISYEVKPIQQQLNDYTEQIEIERFTYLSQYHGKYILAYDEQTLYIVDQHAAMERCMYEEIQNAIMNKSIETQPLLVPLVIEILPSQLSQLERINEQLACINLVLEPFSLNSVVIHELPLFLDDIDEVKFIHELIDAIVNDKQMNSLEIRKEKIASMACHSSVKFNAYLSVEESKKLLSRLSKCVQPFNCPHGRPTMISITDQQLEKEFKRV